jgi:hypothetical protein
MRPAVYLVLAFMLSLMLFVRVKTMNEQAPATVPAAPAAAPAAAK